jgi:sugar lactone lactonase YvrE
LTGGLEVALRAGAQLGEGPTWDSRSGRLLWVDILAAEVHRFDPATRQDTVLRTSQHVGAAKPRAAGGLVVHLRDGIGLYDPDGGFRWLADLAVAGCRGNDAAVDAAGHLWAGTLRYDEAAGGGRLYRVSPRGEVVTVLDGVAVSNGVAWSPDGRRMYYVDSPTRQVDVFEVDAGTGLVAGRRTFLDLRSVPGFPDGLTVDADGCVWVAFWDGGAVRRFTPAGKPDRSIEVPAIRTTACAFGGPGLQDLYITTATAGLDAARLADQPLAGSVFVLPAAGTGLPPIRSPADVVAGLRQSRRPSRGSAAAPAASSRAGQR